MKKLLLSSALIAALSFSGVALAEAPSNGTQSQIPGLTALASPVDGYDYHHRYWDDDDDWDDDDRWDDDDDDWNDDDRWDDDDWDDDDDDRWEHRHRGHHR